MGQGKGLRHSREVCLSLQELTLVPLTIKKILLSSYAYFKIIEIILTGTHMHRVLLYKGKAFLPGGWCHLNISLHGFDIYVLSSKEIPTESVMLDLPQRSVWQWDTFNAAPWMLDFVFFCFFPPFFWYFQKNYLPNCCQIPKSALWTDDRYGRRGTLVFGTEQDISKHRVDRLTQRY